MMVASLGSYSGLAGAITSGSYLRSLSYWVGRRAHGWQALVALFATYRAEQGLSGAWCKVCRLFPIPSILSLGHQPGRLQCSGSVGRTVDCPYTTGGNTWKFQGRHSLSRLTMLVTAQYLGKRWALGPLSRIYAQRSEPTLILGLRL